MGGRTHTHTHTHTENDTHAYQRDRRMDMTHRRADHKTSPVRSGPDGRTEGRSSRANAHARVRERARPRSKWIVLLIGFNFLLFGSQIACHIACDVCALPDMFARLVLLYMCVHPSVSQTGPDRIVILYMCVILFMQLRAFRQARL
jgi:hypothetical protein